MSQMWHKFYVKDQIIKFPKVNSLLSADLGLLEALQTSIFLCKPKLQ